MKITKTEAKRHDWDDVRSWNYKLTHLAPKMSVVYAELDCDHGEVRSQEMERIYYILDGEGEFTVGGKTTKVKKENVFTVPPNTDYDYKPLGAGTLKVLLFMELWDN